jgi:hypothetical protein
MHSNLSNKKRGCLKSPKTRPGERFFNEAILILELKVGYCSGKKRLAMTSSGAFGAAPA